MNRTMRGASTVLVLGGSGVTGGELCRLLLEHGDAALVVAGRDRAKAERTASLLDEAFPGRVSARRVDAGDAESLEVGLAGVDLVAVAAPVLALGGAVAKAALRARADYFDLLVSSPLKLAALGDLRPRIEEDGRCFITDGGVHPGLSAAMVRALAPRFERLERASVGGLIRADWNAYDFTRETMREFAMEMRDYRTEALRDGEWRRLPWREAVRDFDFGPPYGRQSCYLMALEEMRRLRGSVPSLRECGFFVAGFNPVVDGVVMPLGLALKVAPGLAKPYSRLLTWSLRRFGRPPFGCVWQVEAEGETAAGRRQLGLRLVHPDGYRLTAAAAAACLLQYLDGSLRAPGVHLQALAVEPARFLQDLQAMGATLAGRGVDPATVVAR